jgi:hypothetical protein
MNETPLEDTQESFLGLLQCFGLKQPDDTDFHPLNFKHLLKSQETDKSILKILAMKTPSLKSCMISMGEEKLQH